jgi:hypothetical protein
MRRSSQPPDRRASVVARKLKRSVGATYQKASGLGVTLGVGRKKRTK